MRALLIAAAAIVALVLAVGLSTSYLDRNGRNDSATLTGAGADPPGRGAEVKANGDLETLAHEGVQGARAVADP